MKFLAHFLILTFFATFSGFVNAQTVNNASVNIQGANQNVSITQLGANHTANFSLSGDSITVIANQSGQTSQSFSLSINCGVNCPSNPFIINQY